MCLCLGQTETHFQYKSVTVNTTQESGPALTGALTSLLVSLFLTIAVSKLWRPRRYDWVSMGQIALVDDEDAKVSALEKQQTSQAVYESYAKLFSRMHAQSRPPKLSLIAMQGCSHALCTEQTSQAVFESNARLFSRMHAQSRLSLTGMQGCSQRMPCHCA